MIEVKTVSSAVICFLLLSLGAPAMAALTTHDANEEAVSALAEDVNRWTLDAEKGDCKQGEGILKSANEFLAESKLDDGQWREAKQSSEKLQTALHETCESNLKK